MEKSCRKLYFIGYRGIAGLILKAWNHTAPNGTWSDHGQLGIGTISLFEGKPVHVSTITDITAIGAGGNFVTAADKYGKLWYWGLCGPLDYINYVHILDLNKPRSPVA
jgi:hypothetical protein